MTDGRRVVSLIVVGAGGRMGRLVAEQAWADPRFHVYGLVGHTSSPDLGATPHDEDAPHLVDDIATACLGADNPVLVEFALAGATAQTVQAARTLRIPLVIGTTGHDARTQALIAAAAADIPLLHSANMSTGVTALLAHLGPLAISLASFDTRIIEVHHAAKQDAPSGTALALGAALQRDDVDYASVRAGSVPGIHTVFFGGAGEHIEITHRAESRACFAAGALQAAAWLAGRAVGAYSMLDVVRGA